MPKQCSKRAERSAREAGSEHPAYAASLVGYAYLQTDLGHYSTAEKLYDEAGKLLREQLGDQHPAYAAFLNNRAALYAHIGNVTLAEADYRKSLDLKRKLNGPNALTIGASLRNLARLVVRAIERKARSCSRKTWISIREIPSLPRSITRARCSGWPRRSAIAAIWLQRARHSQRASGYRLERIGRKASAVCGGVAGYGTGSTVGARISASRTEPAPGHRDCRRAQGANHPDLAQYLERLGAVYEGAGDYANAEPLYRRSLDHFRPRAGGHADNRIGAQQGGGAWKSGRSHPAADRVSEQDSIR